VPNVPVQPEIHKFQIGIPHSHGRRLGVIISVQDYMIMSTRGREGNATMQAYTPRGCTKCKMS
jgi:hypothetical protein